MLDLQLKPSELFPFENHNSCLQEQIIRLVQFLDLFFCRRGFRSPILLSLIFSSVYCNSHLIFSSLFRAICAFRDSGKLTKNCKLLTVNCNRRGFRSSILNTLHICKIINIQTTSNQWIKRKIKDTKYIPTL